MIGSPGNTRSSTIKIRNGENNITKNNIWNNTKKTIITITKNKITSQQRFNTSTTHKNKPTFVRSFGVLLFSILLIVLFFCFFLGGCGPNLSTIHHEDRHQEIRILHTRAIPNQNKTKQFGANLRRPKNRNIWKFPRSGWNMQKYSVICQRLNKFLAKWPFHKNLKTKLYKFVFCTSATPKQWG